MPPVASQHPARPLLAESTGADASDAPYPGSDGQRSAELRGRPVPTSRRQMSSRGLPWRGGQGAGPTDLEAHSWSRDNEAGIATGWLPGPLSERGRRAAAELGERRRADRLTAAFVSDLARAVPTAQIAFPGDSVRSSRMGGCGRSTTGSSTG